MRPQWRCDIKIKEKQQHKTAMAANVVDVMTAVYCIQASDHTYLYFYLILSLYYKLKRVFKGLEIF